VRGRRFAVLGATLIGIALLGAACGVNGGGGAEQISPGLGLDDTAPTTTTSTTSTTISAQSTVATTPATSATSTTVVQTESVQLWFISGALLNPITIPLTYPATLDQVMVALQAGPSELGPATAFLRTAVPSSPRLVVRDNGNGTATVDLPASFFGNIQGEDQLRAIGQIVLTLTMRPGIGGVTFTVAGEPTAVILGNGEQSGKNQVVTRADYRSLSVSEPQSTTTTAATTVVPTETLSPEPGTPTTATPTSLTPTSAAG
jgi:hypothetical protein